MLIFARTDCTKYNRTPTDAHMERFYCTKCT